MLLKVAKAMVSLTSSKIVHLSLLSDWTQVRKIWAPEEHEVQLNLEDEDLIIQEDSVEKSMNTLFKWKFIVMMCKLF